MSFGTFNWNYAVLLSSNDEYEYWYDLINQTYHTTQKSTATESDLMKTDSGGHTAFRRIELLKAFRASSSCGLFEAKEYIKGQDDRRRRTHEEYLVVGTNLTTNQAGRYLQSFCEMNFGAIVVAC